MAHAAICGLVEGVFANSESCLTGNEQFVQKAIVDSTRLFALAVANGWTSPYTIYNDFDITLSRSSIKRTGQRGCSVRQGQVALSNRENRRRKSRSPKRNQKRHRSNTDIDQIIDKYSADHPLTVGGSLKPMARPTVLAKYGRKEISLDGQFAESEELREIEKCRRCQQRQIICVKVTPDDFWNRRQCTECVQHHSSCSLAPKRNKIRRKRRYVARSSFIYFAKLYEGSQAFLPRLRDPVLPHYVIQTNVLLFA